MQAFTDTNGLRRGQSFPLGATVAADGVNFSVYARRCKRLELLLFDHEGDGQAARVISLDPRYNRTFDYWHVFVAGLLPGQLYGYRAYGPYAPQWGLHFDGDKLLLDPYGRAVALPLNYSRAAAIGPGDNTACAMKSVVVDPGGYDWEGDTPLERPFGETVIYELHVGGFTSHPSSGVAPERRGTYAGLVEKIPYLQQLGITAVELLPVFQFDAQDAPAGLSNYWGYSPVSFFAPHSGFSSRHDPLGPLHEFRDMVKALHRAGIEVILDVVYNHTGENGHDGPTLCYRGLANETYYILEAGGATYANYSGCGNTLNANQSVVRRMILDSLRYWVSELHVDGFRFDLASILSRDGQGHPLAEPPVIWDIETDPVLAGAKIIAEAWDAGGLYQVGSFVGERWKEWNGKFRDDVRSFVRGDPGYVPPLADRLLASPDLYGHEQQSPEQSINFVTCHDGFTLNDLVSYKEKHNEANGENNRDGTNDNLSWNCGVEGPTDDGAIEELRNRQVKNMLALTLLSLGTPMLSMGDEVRRTQGGNNNVYCQDNATSWFDWRLLERHADVLRFTGELIQLRHSFGHTRGGRDLSLAEFLKQAELHWHGVRVGQPDWSPHSRSLAVTIQNFQRTYAVHFVFNAFWEPLEFELPPPSGARGWQRLLDTALPAPDDIATWDHAPPLAGLTYHVAPRSVVALLAQISPL